MKKEGAKLYIEIPPEPKEIKLHKATRERRSQAVWKYLEAHPAINISWLAAEANYQRQNFEKYKRDKKTLPQHLLLKVEAILVNYGLNV